MQQVRLLSSLVASLALVILVPLSADAEEAAEGSGAEEGSGAAEGSGAGEGSGETPGDGMPVLGAVTPSYVYRGSESDITFIGEGLRTTDQWRVGNVTITGLRELEPQRRLIGVLDASELAVGAHDIVIARDAQVIGGLTRAITVLEDEREPGQDSCLAIESVEPQELTVGEVVELTVTGRCFGDAAQLIVNGYAVPEIQIVDGIFITALALPDIFPTPGSYPVSVRLPSGAEVTAATPIEVMRRPTATEDEGGCSATGTARGAWWTLPALVLAIGRIRRRRQAP